MKRYSALPGLTLDLPIFTHIYPDSPPIYPGFTLFYPEFTPNSPPDIYMDLPSINRGFTRIYPDFTVDSPGFSWISPGFPQDLTGFTPDLFRIYPGFTWIYLDLPLIYPRFTWIYPRFALGGHSKRTSPRWGGREGGQISDKKWQGRGEVVWISDVLILKKIIVVFLSSPDYCNCVSYKINSLASFYFISFEEKRRELNFLLFIGVI